MRNCRLFFNRNESGFSLVELLIIIAIIAVLAGMGIPGFSAWLPNYRLKSASQDLLSNFQLAKITAVKQNKYCTVIFTSDEYTVFVDVDKDRSYTSSVDSVLTTRRWADYNDISSVNTGFSDSADNLSFRSNGLPINSGTVILQNTKGKTMNVVVSVAGSVRIQ